jgi:hypothetical protein
MKIGGYTIGAPPTNAGDLERERKKREEEARNAVQSGVKAITGTSAPKSSITPTGSVRKSPIQLPGGIKIDTPKITPPKINPNTLSGSSAGINTNTNLSSKGMTDLTYSGGIPTFKDNSWVGDRWDGLAGLFNQFNMKDNPSTVLGKLGSTIFDQGVLNNAFPNMFGNRSVYERISGKRPDGGAYNNEQTTKDDAKNNPQGDPQGFMPPETTPINEVTFPGEDKASWNGIISADEDRMSSEDPISRRYDLLRKNLRGQESAQSQMEQDALSRKFASMGASNSGAAIKNMQNSSNTAAKRLGDSQRQLDFQQGTDQQTAMESANARNIQRQGLRMSSEEGLRNRALNTAELKEGSRQFEKQYKLDETVTNENLKVARDVMRDNKVGFLGQLFTSIFGPMSMNGIFGGGK